MRGLRPTLGIASLRTHDRDRSAPSRQASCHGPLLRFRRADRHDGTLIVSATDLVGYLACDHLATLELGRVQGLWEKPIRRTTRRSSSSRRRATCTRPRTSADFGRAASRSSRSRRTGLRTPTSSERRRHSRSRRCAAAPTSSSRRPSSTVGGAATPTSCSSAPIARARRSATWSYDIADTKLARSVKARRDPPDVRLRGPARRPPGHRRPSGSTSSPATASGTPHRTSMTSRPTSATSGPGSTPGSRAGSGDGPADTYPDPVDHCRVCTWYPMCIDRRRADDHLSIVAGMRRVDTERLTRPGVPTLASLGGPAARSRAIDGHRPAPQLDSVREQARLQLDEADTGELVFELIEPDPDDPGRGLVALPEPIAVGPLLRHRGRSVGDGGRARIPARGRRGGRWRSRATSTSGRRSQRGGEGRLRAVHRPRHRPPRRPPRDARLPLRRVRVGGDQAPDAARTGRCEDEVDRLLRGDVLVDLLNVVRQGVRASVESYSLKQIEKFYMPRPRGAGHRGRVQRGRLRDVAEGTATRRSSTGSPPTTATTASRRGCSATGSRSAGRRPWLAGRSSTGRGPSRGDPGAVRARSPNGSRPSRSVSPA